MDRCKAEQGRGRKKRKIRREKIREEKESEERKYRCAKKQENREILYFSDNSGLRRIEKQAR